MQPRQHVFIEASSKIVRDGTFLAVLGAFLTLCFFVGCMHEQSTWQRVQCGRRIRLRGSGRRTHPRSLRGQARAAIRGRTVLICDINGHAVAVSSSTNQNQHQPDISSRQARGKAQGNAGSHHRRVCACGRQPCASVCLHPHRKSTTRHTNQENDATSTRSKEES